MTSYARKISGIAIAVAVLLIAAYFTLDKLAPAGSGAYGRAVSFLRPKSEAVEAADQDASASVMVDMAALKSPGFVAVYDDEEGPGKLMGVSGLLPKGVARKLAVVIGQALEPGYYYASLLRDDGDGRFDAEKDLPARDARGVLVTTRFLVSPSE